MNTAIEAGSVDVTKGSPKDLSEDLLVLAAKSGDAAAFVELSSRHRHKILRSVYRITKNWEDAEDALQDSFMKAFVYIKNFEGRSSFSSWLTRIAINSALMILRKKQAWEVPIDDAKDDWQGWQVWEPRDLEENPEQRYAQRERKELLSAAILRLRPSFRDVVHLQQAHDCSIQEIADSLGISVSAAKSRLSRAKATLRASMLRKKLAFGTRFGEAERLSALNAQV